MRKIKKKKWKSGQTTLKVVDSLQKKKKGKKIIIKKI